MILFTGPKLNGRSADISYKFFTVPIGPIISCKYKVKVKVKALPITGHEGPEGE